MKATQLVRMPFLPMKLVPGSVLVGIAILIFWLLLSIRFVQFVAPPSQAFTELWLGFSEGWIIPHAQATFTSALIGFGIAIVGGVSIGLVLGVNTFLRNVFEPVLVSGYAVPKIILFPIIIMFVGIGMGAQVVNVFIHAVFPLIILTTAAVREIEPIYIKVGRCFNASPIDFLSKIYLPAIALPLVVALRLAFSLSIVSVILAELFASKQGLGRLLMQAYVVFNMPRMYAIILLLFSVGFVGNLLLWILEKRLRTVAA